MSGCFFVVAVAIGLMSVKTKMLERSVPQLKASASLSREDVLSPADALQWRQEFVWHRKIPKVCANAWIDDKPCLRMAKLF